MTFFDMSILFADAETYGRFRREEMNCNNGKLPNYGGIVMNPCDGGYSAGVVCRAAVS